MNSLAKLLDFYPMIAVIMIILTSYVASVPFMRPVHLNGEWNELKVFLQLALMAFVGGIMIFLLWEFIVNAGDFEQFKYILYSCGGVTFIAFILLFFIPKY